MTQLRSSPSADEAFLVAVKRMGSLDELFREFAREHSERLWKQLVLTGKTGSPGADTRSRRDLRVMVICATGAAASIKAPELFGMRLAEDGSFYESSVLRTPLCDLGRCWPGAVCPGGYTCSGTGS